MIGMPLLPVGFPLLFIASVIAFMKKESVPGKGGSVPGLGLSARHYLRQTTLDPMLLVMQMRGDSQLADVFCGAVSRFRGICQRPDLLP